mmetsp:Transcript_101694/g.242517  ORF Transcript_101694/g.242517 Transcript_101694/m.242517 type:complete len:124 (+) Transcript_101694:1-372(+)
MDCSKPARLRYAGTFNWKGVFHFFPWRAETSRNREASGGVPANWERGTNLHALPLLWQQCQQWNGECLMIGTFVVTSMKPKATAASIANRPFFSSASAVHRLPCGSQQAIGNSKSFKFKGSKP